MVKMWQQFRGFDGRQKRAGLKNLYFFIPEKIINPPEKLSLRY